MYPNIESELGYTIPRDQIFDTKPPIQKIANKDRGCKHFFPKTTKLTKEYLDKVYLTKLARADTYILRDDWRFGRLIIIAVLLILFLCSFFGIIFMWYTDGFNNILYSKLVISETSPGFEMWRKPTPKPLVKVYVFNYTNIERYEDGTDKKLHVEEKGPYVYEETLERVNYSFNGTYVTYQQKRSYKFKPELSHGRQNDILVVPNMLMLAVASLHRYSNFFTRLTISGGLNGLYAKPFVSLAADRFIIGYEDQLYSLSKTVMRFRNQSPSEKIGLLSQNVGINPDVYTVHTGLNDIEKISRIKSINGKEKLDYWTTDECNSMEATDGSMFSPRAISNKKPVKVFLKQLCRGVDLIYKKDNMILDGDIPSYRYVLPDNIFDSPEKYPENQCFCEMEGGTCPLQGLFNTTLCAMGAPMFLSYPHFYRGDSKLVEAITGLNPENSLHESFFDLHPKMGFIMSASTRLQLNIQIQKTFGFAQLNKYENDLILPMAWFDLSLEDKTLPQDMKDLIGTATHTVALIQNLLKYGCIIIAIVTLVPILANLRHRMTRNRRTASTRPLPMQEKECL